MKKILAILILGFLLSHCKEEKEVVMENDLVLQPDSISYYIESSLSNGTDLLCVDYLHQFDTLRTYYKDKKYDALWWNAITGDSASWAELNGVFDLADRHGLSRNYYFIEVVKHYRKEIEEYSTLDSAYNVIAQLELIISNGLVQMYSDIANGRTDPKELYGYTYLLPLNNKKKIDWYQFLGSKKKDKIIAKIHEHDTTYNQLISLLARYQVEHQKEEQRPIDFSNYPKIEPGDTAPVMIEVLRKLKKALQPDSSILEVEEDTIYSRAFADKIKLLQEQYNLAADGVLGYKTYKVINSTTDVKIDQIKVNLERQRWFARPEPKDAPFVYVNLPEYVAYLYYQDSVKSTKICIGKNLPDNYDELVQRYTDSGWIHKIPKDMETPQIAAKISLVVINPTWTVPRSIIKNEMYWPMRRDPTYLTRNHYVVYRGDSLVDHEKIDWSRYKPNNIPFKIVQTPGTHNALGKVKYLFWNPFSIYMHDTPQKSKFKLNQRAVSHGCVRLEDPILFGEFVSQNLDDYDTDDFRIMMGLEPVGEERLEEYDPEDSTAAIQPIDTTLQLRLDKPIPLFMDYRTVYFDLEWRPHFCYDIYDQNKYILRRLDAELIEEK